MPALSINRNDRIIFASAILLIITGFGCIWLDSAPYGFGFLTLWLAPPLLVIGFLLPIAGLINRTALRPATLIQIFVLHRWKHLVGIFVFLIALATYTFTLEPTASLWDCSEAIAAAYKLEIPHTPGTPLLLLFGRIFTFLSLGNVHHVAWCVNFMSAFFSACAICLTYYIIFFFGSRIWKERPSIEHILIISSSVGALGLTFSDTFWFSAVEAETYGPSCFFMMLLILLILTGPGLKDEQRSRRLILIFYIAGLSFCIHPMAILPIALLTYWWRGRSSKSRMMATLTSISGFLLILFINRFVAVGFFELAFSIDRFTVNTLHFPFNSGMVVLVVALVGASIFIVNKFKQSRTLVWSILFLLAGFSPYLLLMFRSGHNPPIDESNPEDLAMMKAYMNRESYPNPPLVYGPYFDAKIIGAREKRTAWFKGDDRYEVAGHLIDYEYDPTRQTILPRIYSQEARSIDRYRAWTGLGKSDKPDFMDNLTFLVRYQLGHMYFRYLLWDFAGRDSDIQDSDALWPTAGLKSSDPYTRAHNQYWAIPLLLAIVGICIQFRRDRSGFVSNLIFFLITGAVLVLFLNSPPEEPRERNYIYVGSFMALWIWTGLGAAALLMRLPSARQIIPAGILVMAIPAWILFVNYDDHDRSGRTFQIDSARNLLGSCAPNSILFTGGDNDTFPMWYLQEVEGCRTDVRVVVLSYFNTDWYINQLRRPSYRSKSFKLKLSPDDYRQYGSNDVLYVEDLVKDPINAVDYLTLLHKNYPGITMTDQTGGTYHILPSKSLYIPTDAGEMVLHVSKNYLEKNALAFLDVVMSNHWERPIYFNYTSLNTVGLDIQNFVIQEGLVYRLEPNVLSGDDTMVVDTDAAFRNLITNADYSNLADPHVYFNYEDYTLRMIDPVRQSFNDLATALLRKGEVQKADSVMSVALNKLYGDNLRPSITNLQTASLAISLHHPNEAKQLLIPLFNYSMNRATGKTRKGEAIAPVDGYTLRQSAEMLGDMGETTFIQTVTKLLSENAR